MNPEAPAPQPRTPQGARRGRWALWVAAVGALGGVFMLYAQPGFLVMLVDQLWSCF